MNKIFAFFAEVKAEIYKITWPGKDDLLGTIIIVCMVTLVFAAILGAMDLGFNSLLKEIIGS